MERFIFWCLCYRELSQLLRSKWWGRADNGQQVDLGKNGLIGIGSSGVSSLFLQSIELRAMMAPWGPNLFKFFHHPTHIGQCLWISWNSASEPIDCSMPLATSICQLMVLSIFYRTILAVLRYRISVMNSIDKYQGKRMYLLTTLCMTL